MVWHCIVAVAAALICFTVFGVKLLYLLKLGMPNELSQESGSVKKGIIYSFTGAMSPKAKESAYLHLPTYTAGILYHVGTFLSIGLFVLLVITGFNLTFHRWIIWFIAAFLAISSLSGISILMKRVISSNLRYMSYADDYISNILTTAVQVVSIFVLIQGGPSVTFSLLFALLFLWMPFGKTKHALYFFFARIHLGFFYGRRGSWPITKPD